MVIDLSWLVPDLAVGGALAPEHVAVLAQDHGVSAVVDVRAEARDDEEALARHGISFLHLPIEDHRAITEDALRVGVAFATAHLEIGGRVLIHCQHGIGRSALLGLCVLVARGHAPLVILELVKQRRPRIAPSPAQYEAWAGWLRATGHDAPTFTQFAAIAYR